MDPTALRGTRRDHLAHWKGHRNVMAYIGDDRWRTDVKVRVNCKYNPTSSKIVLPNTMQHFRRTTLVKSTEESTWTHLQDRASVKDVTETKNTPKMVVFLPEPRKTRGVVAHLSRQRVFDPEVDVSTCFHDEQLPTTVCEFGCLGI